MPTSPKKRSAQASRLTQKLHAISLYTGAGGLDLGFEAAGFETRAAVEMDDDAVRTLEANRPEWGAIHAPVQSEKASPAKILQKAGLGVGDADILIGGPPCQPFSKSGYWNSGDARRLADPRADTLAAYLLVLRETQPKAFLLENVPGLAFSRKDEGLVFLQRTIEKINRELGTSYSFKAELLRAVEHGVPQDRHRVFVVGARDGTEFEFPRATHAAPPTLGHAGDEEFLELLFEHAEHGGLKPFLRAWDAIGDLENDDDLTLRVTGKWAELLPSIPEGRNYLFHTDRGGSSHHLFGWRRRYWSFLLKLAKRLPSWTIAAQPGPAIGPFHWRNRRLSPKELMRLQTFPESYRVTGTYREVLRQIGNAVPSALSERLALAIRQQLFRDASVDPDRVTLLPNRRTDVPPPEEAAPVPKQYLALVGEHSAHPGTGLGYGALRRMALR